MKAAGILARIVSPLLYLLASVAPAATADEIRVELGRPLGPATQRACAFLHGIKAATPDESLLAPLKIRYAHFSATGIYGLPSLFDAAVFDRLPKTGVQIATGVSGYFNTRVPGHEGEKYYPGDGGDWASWETIVSSTVLKVREKAPKVWWNIWNEPDNSKTFWPRDQERFLEAWRRAYRTIRSIDPSAVIFGPSAEKYSSRYLISFLQYCRENQCVPDYLSWHELTGFERHVRQNIDEMRRWCAENGLIIKGVNINEYCGPSGQYLPAAAVGFISALEKAKVEYACKAVWTKLGILNGAATPDGKQPTSLWWVYKSYSDATGILYDVTETKDIRAIAAVDRKASSTRVLIGNQSEEELPVNLVLQDLSKAGFGPKAVVRRRLIPNTSEKALEAPQAPEDLSVSAENDILKVDVGVLPGYGAMEVILLGEEAK